MAIRFWRSGNTDEALTTSAVDVRELLGTGFSQANRYFWLKELWVYNSHATTDGVVTLWDQAEGVAVAANERFSAPCPANTLTLIPFSGKGMRFRTNCCAAISAGTVAIYQAGCNGYEEGD